MKFGKIFWKKEPTQKSTIRGDSQRSILRRTTALALAVAATVGLSFGATARPAGDDDVTSRVWEYTVSLNSVEGYSAFIASFPEETQKAYEARLRVINLLGEFDHSDLELPTPSRALLEDDDNLTAGALTASDTAQPPYNAPYGKRRWTLREVYVNDRGYLVDADGAYITPQGARSTSPYSVTSDNRLVAPGGVVVANDAAVYPRDISPALRSQTIIGRLTLRTRDLDNVATRDEASRNEFSLGEALFGTSRSIAPGQETPSTSQGQATNSAQPQTGVSAGVAAGQGAGRTAAAQSSGVTGVYGD